MAEQKEKYEKEIIELKLKVAEHETRQALE